MFSPINFFRVIYLCRFCNNIIPNLNHLTDLCMVQIIILLHLHCMMNWFNLWQKMFRMQMHSQDISKKKYFHLKKKICGTRWPPLFDTVLFVWHFKLICLIQTGIIFQICTWQIVIGLHNIWWSCHVYSTINVTNIGKLKWIYILFLGYGV